MENKNLGLVVGGILITASVLLYSRGQRRKKEMATLNADGYPLRLDKGKIPTNMLPFGTATDVALTGKEYIYDTKYYISPLANGYMLILISDFGTDKSGYSYNQDGTINTKIADKVNKASTAGFPYKLDLSLLDDTVYNNKIEVLSMEDDNGTLIGYIISGVGGNVPAHYEYIYDINGNFLHGGFINSQTGEYL